MGLYPANQVKPGQGPVAAFVAHRLSLQATFPTALQPHSAIIVLPDFARSCTADGLQSLSYFHDWWIVLSAWNAETIPIAIGTV
jgi:hypothetical protein